jgi:hypothetical protein
MRADSAGRGLIPLYLRGRGLQMITKWVRAGSQTQPPAPAASGLRTAPRSRSSPTTTRPATPATATSGHEYGLVTRRLAAVRWSRGLRARVLSAALVRERTDMELAAEEVNGELRTAIESAAWSRLRLAGLDLAVLVAAEDGNLAAVTALVRSASARLSPPNAVQG